MISPGFSNPQSRRQEILKRCEKEPRKEGESTFPDQAAKGHQFLDGEFLDGESPVFGILMDFNRFQ